MFFTKILVQTVYEIAIKLTPSYGVENSIIRLPGKHRDGDHVVQIETLDEHPHEFDSFSIFQDGVQDFTKHRLKGKEKDILINLLFGAI